MHNLSNSIKYVFLLDHTLTAFYHTVYMIKKNTLSLIIRNISACNPLKMVFERPFTLLLDVISYKTQVDSFINGTLFNVQLKWNNPFAVAMAYW